MNLTGKTPKERSRRVKIYSIVLVVIALVSFYLPVIARPNEARALDGALGAILGHTLEAIKYIIRQARKVATDVAFKNAIKVYMTKFAEDTAVWVASAGKGQSPLYVTDPHYWTNLSDAAAGDFLDTAASKFGIDICKPVDTRQQYSVEGAVRALIDPANWCQNLCQREYQTEASDEFLIGADVGINVTSTLAGHEGTIQRIRAEAAKCTNPYDPVTCNGEDILGPYICIDYPLGSCLEVYERDVAKYKQEHAQGLQRCMNLCSAQKRVARCTASQAFSAFNAASYNGVNVSKLKGSDFLKSVTYYYEPGENDIGQLMTLADKARDAAVKAAQEFRDTSNSKTQPLRDPVTGKVKTPADITGGAAQEGLTKDPSGKIFSLQTGSPLADAIGVFTSTLTRRLLQRIFERGFNPAAEQQNLAIAGNVVLTGAQAARELFATVAVPDFRTDTGQSTTLDELVACPDSNAGPSNCVLDDKFRQAIDQGLTVEEALKAGLLDGRKLFGYKTLNPDGTSIEPDFREGYPYRSLIMLRRLRIVPVGWELAAQAIKKSGTVTSLGALVESYGKCGPAAADYSPFCGLVDPAWVLKAPGTFCKVAGAINQFVTSDYGPDQLFPDAPQVQQLNRVQACVDEKTCLQEDEKGNCLAYGYCIQERPSWKFGGDQCQSTFQSCDTFTDASGTESSYVKATLDTATCNATNAGCQWYCQHQDATGNFDCQPTFDAAKAKAYFTSKVRSCPKEAEGCNEFLRTTNQANLLTNGGFETTGPGTAPDDDVTDVFPGWQNVGMTTFQALTQANSGTTGGNIIGNDTEHIVADAETGMPLSGRSFTLSFSAKAKTSCGAPIAFRLSSTYNDTGPQTFLVGDTAAVGSNWQRFTKTISYPAHHYDNTTVSASFFPNGCDTVLDDVQLEEGKDFSAFKEYGNGNAIYLNKNRLSCTPEEVGCDLYSSATDRIPGVATDLDACPADKVGCRSFQEMPVTGNGADPTHVSRVGSPAISFIPSTGRVCAAAYVGCEEYTNLDEVARGGEGKEYYTYIRECEKPDTNPATHKTYYSWLGSDTTGFQLKSYILVRHGGVYYPGDHADGPKYQSSFNAILESGKCNAASFNNPAHANYSPDCRQFFDANLVVFYRFYSKTVSVSDDCHPLRNTVDNAVYSAIPAEGVTCPASAAQCREYRGPSGYNTRLLFADDFEDGDTAGWVGGSPSNTAIAVGGTSLQNTGSSISYDVSPLLQQGKSYVLTFWAGSGDASEPTITAQLGAGPDTFAGSAKLRWDTPLAAPIWNFYTLGPLHLNRAPAASDTLVIGGGVFFIDNIKLIETTDSVYQIKDSYQRCEGFENCDRYTNRAGQVFTLKSFTRLCSEDKIGCEALVNTQNSDSPFDETFANGTNPNDASFGSKTVPADRVEAFVNNPQNYCRPEEQGCTLYGQPTLKLDAPTNTLSVDAYKAVDLVDDPDEYVAILCKHTEVGCDAFTNKRANAPAYFRRPEPMTCEYRSDIVIAGKSQPGWYKTGTSGLRITDLCPSSGPAPAPAGSITPVQPYTQPAVTGKFCLNDPRVSCTNDAECTTPPPPGGDPDKCLSARICQNNPKAACETDANCLLYGGACTARAGYCPPDQAGCKEYRDPTDPLACVPKCLLTIDEGRGTNVPVDSATCAVNTSATPGTCENDATTLCAEPSDCTAHGGGSCMIPQGCRGYWYLQQTVENNASECNSITNAELGCRSFYTPVP